MKSMPRVTPYSLSPPFRCFRFRDGPGAGEDLFRFCEVEADDSAVSRWVDVTVGTLVIRTQGEMKKRTLFMLGLLRFVVGIAFGSGSTLV